MNSNYWLTTIVIEHPVKSSKYLRIALEKEHMEAPPLWKPMQLQPVFFTDSPFFGNGTAADLFNKGLAMPSGSNLTTEEKERIASVIHMLIGDL